MERKSFKQFLRSKEQPASITEELVNKGFAVGQQARFQSKKTSLKSALSKARSEWSVAIQAGDASKKIDALAVGLQNLADAIELQGELLNHIINVSVANVLMSDDVGTVVKKALAQRR